MKKKTVKKAAPKPEIPEGMEGKAKYLGVPCAEYAIRLLESQSVTNSATEKASRIEKGLFNQGYSVDEIKTEVEKILKGLLSG